MYKKLINFIVLFLFCHGAMAATKALTRIESEDIFSANENYAIIVGVDEYDEVAPLNYAVADAQSLASFFKSQGYQVSLLVNTAASRKRILDQVTTVARVAGSHTEPRGNIVFAYSGHGFREGRENYLAPSEVDPDNLQDTGVALAEVSDILEAANVKQRALFIDACRNDPGRGPSNKGQRFEIDENAEGLAILYSTGAGAVSYEDPKLSGGVFSHFLLQGFEGQAAQSDGLISFNNLASYVQKNVKNYVLGRYRKAQVPYVGGERSGEFVLARSTTGSDNVSDIPPENNVPEPIEMKLAEIPPATQAEEAVIESQEKSTAVLLETKPKSNLWKIIGGVAVVALIAGAAAGGDKTTDPPTTIGVTIQVPVQ